MSGISIQLTTFDWGAVSAISTIAIAILGFLINQKLKQRKDRAERFGLLVEYRREIIQFSNEFLDVCADALSECLAADEKCADFERCRAVSSRLSSLADKGRFLFPNYRDESGFGSEKGPAFEGIRREPLDAILAAYYAIESVRAPEKSISYLRNSYRELVKTGQPLSKQFSYNSAASFIIEAKRAYLNSVVPETFPNEWLEEFSELLGPMRLPTEAEEAEIDEAVQRHLSGNR